MIFRPTAVEDVMIVDLDRKEDDRGFFARSWCADEFARQGLNTNVVQCNVSYNNRRGVVRGMHYQAAPHEEAKLVRCTGGAIYDVVLDLRRASHSYKKWLSFELSAINRRMLYIPEGVAHGFQTLSDTTEILYQMSQPYDLESSRTARWDDPAFGIQWPISEAILSEKDRTAPLWEENDDSGIQAAHSG